MDFSTLLHWLCDEPRLGGRAKKGVEGGKK